MGQSASINQNDVIKKDMEKSIIEEKIGIKICEIINSINPFDLIVFKGGGVMSTIISDLEHLESDNGSITHVGVAINKNYCPDIQVKSKAEEGKMYIWESTYAPSVAPHSIESKTNFGVQIRDLEEVIKEYLSIPGSSVGHCPLIVNPSLKQPNETIHQYNKRQKELIQKTEEVYKKYDGCYYDVNLFDLFGCIFPKLRPIRNLIDLLPFMTNRWLFCSEFVAILYEQLGIIHSEEKKDNIKQSENIADPRDISPVKFLPNVKDSLGIVRAPIWIYKIGGIIYQTVFLEKTSEHLN